MHSGLLKHPIVIEREVLTPDGFGGQDRAWAVVYACLAAFNYRHGKEAVQSGGLTGAATFKVAFWSTTAGRSVTVADRLRNTRTGVVFNIREADPITDPAWVWLVVESGVAV